MMKTVIHPQSGPGVISTPYAALQLDLEPGREPELHLPGSMAPEEQQRLIDELRTDLDRQQAEIRAHEIRARGLFLAVGAVVAGEVIRIAAR